MRKTHFIFLVAFATCITGGLSNEEIPTPEKRLISTFQIVRFPNEACIGTSSRNGTCYTSAECSDKGGTSSGSCADGFGVCCTFVITTCSGSSSENITYWDHTPSSSTLKVATTCDLTVSPMNENICQLRIDFDAFVITGPSTATDKQHWRAWGQQPQAATATAHDASFKSNCLVDRFSVNGVSSSNQPPTICGTNTGFHMYVDAHPESNTMSFTLAAAPGDAPTGITGTGGVDSKIDTRGVGSFATRNWDIKVLQYECGYINAAPPGCTQYFWGQTAGKFKSYNIAGTEALANQDQRVCIRRERDYCYICFSGTTTEFAISGNENAANAYTYPTQACGYGAEATQNVAAKAGLGLAEKAAGAYDCGILPGAFITAGAATGTFAAVSEANIKLLTQTTYQVGVGPQIGSRGVFGPGAASVNVLAAGGNVTPQTLCSKHVPFMMIFRSDSFEGTGAGGEHAGAGLNPGINLPWFTYKCV